MEEDADAQLDRAICERSEHFQKAVAALMREGVVKAIAFDILANDRQIRIAEDQLCQVISRCRPTGLLRSPGASWRVALRKHHVYGPDPVRQATAEDSARPREKQHDGWAEMGRGIIAKMDQDEITEAHTLLAEHFRQVQKPEFVMTLLAMTDPARDPAFWKAVAKYGPLIGIGGAR